MVLIIILVTTGNHNTSNNTYIHANSHHNILQYSTLKYSHHNMRSCSIVMTVSMYACIITSHFMYTNRHAASPVGSRERAIYIYIYNTNIYIYIYRHKNNEDWSKSRVTTAGLLPSGPGS